MVKAARTGELEFESFDEASLYFGELLQDGAQLASINKANENTYKREIVELRNVSFSIPGGKVLSENPYHKPFPFWAISESLSELLNLSRPIMERYDPSRMDESYVMTPDRMPCYSYGERWHVHNQVMNIFNRLNTNPTSKRAFMAIYSGHDTELGRPDIPCTIGHHFDIRDGKLDVAAHMRSWDFFAGNIYDVFLASVLQKSFVSWLRHGNLKDLEPGRLHFYGNSLHYYPVRVGDRLEKMLAAGDSDFYNDKASILFEGGQKPIEPAGFSTDMKTYFDDMHRLLDAESASYNGNFVYAREKLAKIRDPLIRDFTRVYILKNAKTCKNSEEINRVEFETLEMRKWCVK